MTRRAGRGEAAGGRRGEHSTAKKKTTVANDCRALCSPRSALRLWRERVRYAAAQHVEEKCRGAQAGGTREGEFYPSTLLSLHTENSAASEQQTTFRQRETLLPSFTSSSVGRRRWAAV